MPSKSRQLSQLTDVASVVTANNTIVANNIVATTITATTFTGIPSANNGMLLQGNQITANVTIYPYQNALSVGPILQANGTTVVLSSGSRWIVI
jgi:hypothetical protein